MAHRILLSLPNGWSIRNMIYTGIVDQLAQTCEVIIIVPEHFRVGLLEKVKVENVIVETFKPRPEPLSWRLLRQLRKKVFLEVNHIETELIKERAQRRELYQRAGGVLLRYISRLPMSKNLITITEAADFLVNRDRLYADMIERHHPTLVVGTTPFEYREESLFRAAMRQGIPCVCFIPSWDNLSSKGVINQRFRRLLVWNEVMRDEILSGYPEYRAERVKVVGIPQFDVYCVPPSLNYEAWCQQYALDPNRHTILYSTAPPRLFQYDPVIVERIVEGINSGHLPRDIQVLVRCHPWDSAARYEHLRSKGTVGICGSSTSTGGTADHWVPPIDELLILRDCMAFSVMNINVASTMSIDAAVCGKPVLNIAFDGDEELPYERSSRRFYDYSHYKRVVASGAVHICHSYDELFQGIIDYLDNPQLDSEKRSALVEMMCPFNDGKSSQRCVTELFNCIE